MKTLQTCTCLIGIFTILFFASCSNQPRHKDIILAVNDYEMTKDEFNLYCAENLEYKDDLKITLNIKKDMLNSLIRKELLIQEAKKMGLDQNSEFIAAIEKYWEATLIKLLMQKKNEQIEKITLVSQTEIKKKYQEYKSKNNSLPPFEQIEKELTAEILETKKTKALDNWMNALQAKASVRINESLLKE